MNKGVHALRALRGKVLACRGCLGAMATAAEAGLCARCWEGLTTLAVPRCPRCALEHAEEEACGGPSAWTRGDALWDYHGGRPPLGALLVPGIKSGENGWKAALLAKASAQVLPEWTGEAAAVVPVPTLALRRLLRGFDLAADWAEIVARSTGKPVLKALAKHWRASSQTGRTESERRRLPKNSFRMRPGVHLEGLSLVLTDDVWTTGATLHRCAQVLLEAGAKEVNVLTLFRAT